MRKLIGLGLLSAIIALAACKPKAATETSPQKGAKGKKASLDSSGSSEGDDEGGTDSDDSHSGDGEEGEEGEEGGGGEGNSSGGSGKGGASNKAPKDMSDLELAQRYAPIMKLVPQELYYPMDPEEFLKNKNQDEDFFRSARTKFHEGKQGRTIVNMSADRKLLQYWFFFAKNGCQGTRFQLATPNPFGKPLLSIVQVMELCNLAIHEGDWENVTIKLKDDLSEAEEIYISAHGHGNWLRRGAFEWKDARPIVFSALNSHALYAKDQKFHAEFTADSTAFPPSLGVQWLQFGDTVSDKASVHAEPRDGKGMVDFDSGKALWLAKDLMKTETGAYKSDWGKKVDGQKVLPPPGTDNPILRKVLEEASKIAFEKVAALKGKSGGGAPPSPWVREDWKNFDKAGEGRVGVSRELIMGPIEGIPFDDYTDLKSLKSFKVNQVTVWASGNDIYKVCFLVSGKNMCHGHSTGEEKTFKLADDEYISEVETFNMGHSKVSGVRLLSSKGQKIEVGQLSGGNRVHVKVGDGLQIVGWYGAHDSVVHSLGAIQGTR